MRAVPFDGTEKDGLFTPRSHDMISSLELFTIDSLKSAVSGLSMLAHCRGHASYTLPAVTMPITEAYASPRACTTKPTIRRPDFLVSMALVYQQLYAATGQVRAAASSAWR